MARNEFKDLDRLILYVSAWAALGASFFGFALENRLKSVEKRQLDNPKCEMQVRDLENWMEFNLKRPRYEVRVEDVIGQDAPEKFYRINGKRVYLEIDGKPVEQYFKK